MCDATFTDFLANTLKAIFVAKCNISYERFLFNVRD